MNEIFESILDDFIETISDESVKNISVNFDREKGVIDVNLTVFIPATIQKIDIPIKFTEG